jgi:uncharacterized protein (DUF1330 family)
MPALWIARIKRIKDPAAMAEYGRLAPIGLADYGGRVVAHATRVFAPEEPGEAPPVGVIEFPSVERALAFYESPAYQAARLHRERGADYEFVIVEVPG